MVERCSEPPWTERCESQRNAVSLGMLAKIKTLGWSPLRKFQALQAILEGCLADCRENAPLKWLPAAPGETRLPELSFHRSLVKSRVRTAHAGPSCVNMGVSRIGPRSRGSCSPLGKPRPQRWGGAYLGLQPRPVPPRPAWVRLAL